MRLVCTLVALCLLPLSASAQVGKEPGPLAEFKLELKDLKKPLAFEDHIDPILA
jgi:hypothetical protein